MPTTSCARPPPCHPKPNPALHVRRFFLGTWNMSGFLSEDRPIRTLREVLRRLKESYCGTVGYEVSAVLVSPGGMCARPCWECVWGGAGKGLGGWDCLPRHAHPYLVQCMLCAAVCAGNWNWIMHACLALFMLGMSACYSCTSHP